ncbi:MAG TPA: cation:proton antiporter, partial [Parachlamydiaceae bacterium]|nr:cation:proton antiporter [Parachlamydiaceae bacterium]
SQNEYYNVQIVMILAVGLALATALGYFSQKAKLSPILGYLVAGYCIGPYSPGFVADAHIAEQLAEIGVILMMFGVGLHLKWQELINVRNIAVPGAIIQTLLTTIAGTWLVYSYGWPLETGIVIGLAIGVASTVVMIRVLSDNHMVTTPEGHIAIGWLIVEDILTVIALLLLPALAASVQGDGVSALHVAEAVGMALLKCILLVAIMIFAGFKVVSWIFLKVARTRSQELFTLTVLSLIFVIATGSAMLFGTSIALGAFMAGLVIGQTEVRHQASANALPLKDTFAVIFFLSVGMLFNPLAIMSNFPLFIGIMAIILLIKPLIAYFVVVVLRKPFRTALIVAFSLAQIGEFSFIVSEEALKLKLLPDEGLDIIVACALISIALNPLLFSACKAIVYRWDKESQAKVHAALDQQLSISKQAIIVGFGPIGHDVAKYLEEMGIVPVIIDTNVDTITTQKNNNREVVYGDATVKQILEAAQIDTASILVITTPEIKTSLQIVELARELNKKIYIIARATYRSDKKQLAEMNVCAICDEEESRHAFIDTIKNLSTA